MGGRGSGGGKSSGGRISDKQLLHEYETNFESFMTDQMDKLSKMNNKELNNAYKANKKNMNDEKFKFNQEAAKMEKIRNEYRNIKTTDPDYKAKTKAFDKQLNKVRDINSIYEAKKRIFLATDYEKHIRTKQNKERS